MLQRLKNKVALLTAAGQGIGRATALRFVEEGAKVYATDINKESLAALKKDCPAIETRVLDVTNSDAIIKLSKELQAVDILFNCAGFVHHGTIFDCEEKDWDFSYELNVKATYRMIRAFLPAMIENGGASIVNMSSVASSIIAAPNRFIYGVTKAAVIGMTKSVAADFVTQGIRCNAICPGTVESPSLEQRIKSLPGDFAENKAAFIARQPIGRVGKADEVAALAAYLASDESGFTTGTINVIDGGWSNT